MFDETVVEFCAVVAGDSDLQARLKTALQTGADGGAGELVAIAGEKGFQLSESAVLETFTAERERRETLDNDEYGETRIQRREDDNVAPGVAGLRTVALSGDWRIGGGEIEESDSVLD